MSSEAVGWVYRHSPYDRGTFAVHHAIADSANDQFENRFWMAERKLARKARVTVKTARKALLELCEDGYLVKLRDATTGGPGGGETAEYEFVFVEGAPLIFDTRRRTAETRPLAGMRDLSDRGVNATPPPAGSEGETEPLAEGSGTPGARGKPDPLTQVVTQGGEPKESSSDVEVIDPRWADAERLANLLADHVGSLHAEAKRPTVTKAWVRDMERMIRLDGRDPAKVERLIAWVHGDEFWRSNIASPSKLRAQYDRLVAKANEQLRKRGPRVRDTSILDRLDGGPPGREAHG